MNTCVNHQPNNPFLLNAGDYTRDIDVLKHYVDQAASLISTQRSIPYDAAVQWVKTQLRPGGRFEFKDPEIRYLEREENGDRVEKTGTLWSYVRQSVANDEIIAPTFTTYIPSKQKPSVLARHIRKNLATRTTAKKKMFAAGLQVQKLKAEGKDFSKTEFEQVFQEALQTLTKLSNNAISGAHVSTSTPLSNKTAHSTLTSNCRCTAGYGNTNNEKLLSGNRHYWSPDIVINNIASVVSNTDYQLFASVMIQHDLHYPSAQETMQCILRSSSQYWRSQVATTQISDYVQKLTPLQRAAFVYTGDLYQVKQFNDAFMRKFIGTLSSVSNEVLQDPAKMIASCREEYLILAAQICEEGMKGAGSVKDVEREKPDVFMKLAATTKKVQDTLLDYSQFVMAIMVTKNMPASMAHFPYSIRHAALTGDTDSTIFTVQDWVKWYFGDIIFTPQANALSATMIFIAAESVAHLLAKMSANYGVEKENIFMIAMKNEYKFDVFVPTQVGKHYFAIMSSQEGNLYKEYKNEIKGVHLKNSTVSKKVIKQAETMMLSIMDDVIKGRGITKSNYLKQIADTEREIIANIKEGKIDYFKKGKINSADSYAKTEIDSPYQHYLLWNEVFAPKYGAAPPPPYSAVKIPTIVDTPRKFNKWIEQMQDKELAARMLNYSKKHQKDKLGTILLPEQVALTSGTPQELRDIIDVRRSVLDSTQVFYLIMETLDHYMLNGKKTRLISDEY